MSAAATKACTEGRNAMEKPAHAASELATQYPKQASGSSNHLHAMCPRARIRADEGAFFTFGSRGSGAEASWQVKEGA
ncbi:hypothetical protein PF007_g30007 [Phytophthora fragariae]|uniref:Uncharacterized protein n=1 Tax=Phytophthora fragariae TaxID=53985 RepID=A0A6A3DEP0_9STRA|nr:hypothetical protein PF009_g31605 [Phytophthora fragariae]KAE9062176.1 hypothetical protein PF007_g30007 [Phytophthora fragariae]KAE9064545.1 hypothetical protein PF006_g30670 [Phytophthora fragariae]KAE9165452.1 hypothetical protein PF004_g29491 [Phytophthora fragariae]